MKKKLAWMLALICSLSLFSDAKQTGKKCDKTTVYKAASTACRTKPAAKTEGGIGVDLSPLNFFLATF